MRSLLFFEVITVQPYYLYMTYRVLDEKTIIKSRFLDDEDIYNYLDTTFEIPDTFVADVVEVSEDYVCRPDLVSLKAYSDDSYTDIICKVNGISNPFELNKGDLLILPAFGDLQNFYVRPNVEDTSDSTDKKTPVAKRKNEKRKANEAVTGDKRFSIDKNKRVIIY